jgi:tetratricopeptide (TPR) repeat protein
MTNNPHFMKCPVCGAVYRPPKESTGVGETSSSCRRCKADLSALLRLHDQAIWYHRQALHLCSQGYYAQAAAQNQAALALHYRNADFHALAGKIWALQGEFPEAIAAWQQALKFEPQNAFAGDCLQMIKLMTTNNSP